MGSALNSYDVLNHRYRNYFIFQQINHEERLLESFVECPRAFHSYIRSKKIGMPTIGPLRGEDGNLIDRNDLMGEIFADKFCSVFLNTDPIDPAPHQDYSGGLDSVIVNLDLIETVVRNLDNDSREGCDLIHPRLVRAALLLIILYF